jgi:hypothetical protein
VVFVKFKELADRKKVLDDRDLEVIAMSKASRQQRILS